jgi:hypothetical protein
MSAASGTLSRTSAAVTPQARRKARTHLAASRYAPEAHCAGDRGHAPARAREGRERAIAQPELVVVAVVHLGRLGFAQQLLGSLAGDELAVEVGRDAGRHYPLGLCGSRDPGLTVSPQIRHS